MRHVSKLLLVFCLLLFQFPSAGSAEGQVETKEKNVAAKLFQKPDDYMKQELIIKFKPGTSADQKDEILKKHSLVETQSNPTGNFTLAKTRKTDLASLAGKLMASKQVVYVEPNYKMTAQFTPADPYYKKQWYAGKINLPGAWNQSKGASNVKVAVIDGGVQQDHPDLKGKIVNPYNAVTSGTSMPADDHATHVAGIIAATMNKSGIAGVAPNVKIMPINVFEGEEADIFNVAKAITYAADAGANLINLSLGTYSYSSPLNQAVKYAESKGVLLVAAAGNDTINKPSYPVALSQTIGVSATDEKDKITYFSNYGSFVDFAAPGINIYSTIARNSYQSMDGTSMATPIVTGVAALVLSKNPFLTSAQVVEILKKSSVDLGKKGRDSYYGYGRVDANKALLNTPTSISPLEIRNTTFNMNGTSKLPIAFQASSGGSVSLQVLDSKDKVVKKLITNKAWTGGKISAQWDGKLDDGSYAESGPYKLVARIASQKTSRTQTKTIKVVDQRVPIVTPAKTTVTYSPLAGKLVVPIKLNKKSKITTAIVDRKNKLVKRLVKDYQLAAGNRVIVWDGKNSQGTMLKSGTYKIKIDVVDFNGLKGATTYITVPIDTIAPAATATTSSNTLKMDGQSKITANFVLEEASVVSASLITDKGDPIKQWDMGTAFKSGTITLDWDGLNNQNQPAKEGNYQYLLELKDVAGNKNSVKSDIFLLQNANQKQ